MQAAIKAVKAGEGVVNADGTLTAGPAVLQPEEYSSRLVAADPGEGGVHRGTARRRLVVLDGTVTEELEAEGWAKDRIRELQELRKSTGLDVSDRIAVVMSVPAAARRLGPHPQRPDRGRNPGHQLRIRRARRMAASRSATGCGWRSPRPDQATRLRISRTMKIAITISLTIHEFAFIQSRARGGRCVRARPVRPPGGRESRAGTK